MVKMWNFHFSRKLLFNLNFKLHDMLEWLHLIPLVKVSD